MVIIILISHDVPNVVCIASIADVSNRKVCTASIAMFDAKTVINPIPVKVINFP